MCVDKNRFSKTYKFDDVNYTSASGEQQEAIFLAYCDVLNGIDTTADLQITIHNNKVNRRDFERKILLSPQNDGFNKYREEYNEMLREKLMQGQNGISCNKYMTLTVTAADIEAAAQKIATIEVHLRMGFQKIGSRIKALNANQRVRILADIFRGVNNEQSANFLYELYKRARKWGGIPTGITQNVEDLLKSETGRSMLANSEFILMPSQSATDREKLAELLKIPEESMAYVTNAIAGSGLMFAGSYGITPFKDDFPQNTELYKLMTTRFGEADNSEGKNNEGNSDKNTA